MWWSTQRNQGKHSGAWWKTTFAGFFRHRQMLCCDVRPEILKLLELHVFLLPEGEVRRVAGCSLTTESDRASRGRDFIKWKSRAAETTQKISMQPGWEDLWVWMSKHTLLGKTIQFVSYSRKEKWEQGLKLMCFSCIIRKINQQKNNQECLDLIETAMHEDRWPKPVRMATAHQYNSFYVMPPLWSSVGILAILWPFCLPVEHFNRSACSTKQRVTLTKAWAAFKFHFCCGQINNEPFTQSQVGAECFFSHYKERIQEDKVK